MASNYIFGDLLGNFMGKIDLRTQYEASMMSMTLMIGGLIVTAIYVWFFIDFPLWYKIVLEINFLAGFIFMNSFLITTFQQYRNYMEVQTFQSNMKGGL
jgi:hypothetical protein